MTPETPNPGAPPPVRLSRYLASRMFWISALPILAAGIYYGWTLSRRAEAEAEQRVQEASRVCAQYIGDYFILHRQALAALAGTIDRTGALAHAQLGEWLAATRAAHPGLLTMLVTDDRGHLLATSPEQGSLLGRDVSDREYFTRPMRTDRPYISGVFLGRNFGQDPIVAIAAPIHRTGGAIAGVVEGSMRLSRIETLLGRFAGLPGRDFLLVDQEQRVVFSTMPDLFPVLSDTRGQILRGPAGDLRGEQVFLYHRGPPAAGGSRDWIVGAAPIQIEPQGQEWAVYVFQDRRELDRELRSYLAAVGVALIALLLGAAYFGRVVVHSTVRPIEDLARFARQSRSGDAVAAPVAADAIGEIALLEADIVSMLAAQRAATRQLEDNLAERERLNREMREAQQALERSHAELEGAVRDRTAELSRMYDRSRLDAENRTKLLNEVNHRVTNNLSSILGLLVAAERRAAGAGQPSVVATLEDLRHRIRSLLAVHRLLSASQWSPVNLGVLAERILHDATAVVPPDVEVRLEIETTPVQISPRQAHNLSLVLNELATNALKHALVPGSRQLRLAVTVRAAPDLIELVVRDSGPGYPAEVLASGGSGLGLGLIGQLVRESLRGEVVLENDGGAVTRVRLRPEDLGRT